MTNYNPSGVICIKKHTGASSHDIVNMVRRLYSTKQVGHTGTLDPLATGVLPVMVGRAVKAAEYLSDDEKGYTAELKLGITTDTGDITGKVINKTSILPSEEQVIYACKKFEGEIEQIPPMYSALKVNGKKLVNLARKGIVIERQPRKIFIKSLNVTSISVKEGIYRLVVLCSKGTYIRTLCTDIGDTLGCGVTMSALERTKSGVFTIDGSITINELEALSLPERLFALQPTENLFDGLPIVRLADFFEHLAHSGAEIYQSKIETSFPLLSRVRLYGKKGFFALGEVREYPDGTAIKPIKQFVLRDTDV